MLKKIMIIFLLILIALLCYSYVNAQYDSHAKLQNEKGMNVETYSKKVNRNDKLVLVYFHADWCVPCIKLKPEIDKLFIEEKNSCEVIFIDLDNNPLISRYFEINSLPLFFLYKHGNKVWENIGVQSKSQLIEKIQIFK